MHEDRVNVEHVIDMVEWARTRRLARTDRPIRCSIVLDPEYRHPYHPDFGMARPEVAGAASVPTDPEVLRHIGSLVREFTEHYQRVKGRTPEFGPVYTEKELAAAEKRIGARLPEDVRALYRLAGADSHELGLLDRYSLTPLSSIRACPTTSHVNHIEDLFDFSCIVLEADPPGQVRRVAWNDRWVQIALDGGGGACAVDLDPAAAGRRGQLLEYGRGIHRIRVIAESATALLTAVVEALRRNDTDPDYTDADYLGVRIPQRPVPRHDASASVAGRDVADALADRADLEHIQQLRLDDGEFLDLHALQVTPHLRQLRINRAGHVNLWLPETVEALKLDARQANLSDIAGHPALWNLTVQGMRIRVEQLAALPALARLDASAAEVDDVAALADLDLRILILNSEQWTQLQAADRLPTQLAAARCSDGTPPAQAIEWSDWLRAATRRQ